MLSAVLDDFRRLPNLCVETLLSAEDVSPVPDGVQVHRTEPSEVEATFRARARHADFTLVIAPEFDDLLESRSRWVVQEGGTLLGPSPPAIRLTADKLTLAQHWLGRGVPTPVTQALNDAVPGNWFPVVCKPRCGAGSTATFRAQHPMEVPDQLAVRREEYAGEMIVQPLVRGQPASMAAIVGRQGMVPLRAASQRLSEDGRFHYLGGAAPLTPSLAERAQRLTLSALDGIHGLAGYVGVDLILGRAEDGSEDRAIEINPRLTTSYVGLRRLAETNLAELMLMAATGQGLPSPRWRDGRVEWNAQGEVRATPDTGR